MTLPVRALFSRLLEAYGPQHWWPADNPFDILAGAVLVQNTRWENVEGALKNLHEANVASEGDVLALSPSELESLLRPAGTFRVKAKRLRALCAFVREAGGVDALNRLPTLELRSRLLAVHGIGRETADVLLVYLFERPVFVVDAYTRRLFERLGRHDALADYETLRANVEREFKGDAAAFNELHALIVEHAKRRCRTRPACAACSVSGECAFAARRD